MFTGRFLGNQDRPVCLWAHAGTQEPRRYDRRDDSSARRRGEMRRCFWLIPVVLGACSCGGSSPPRVASLPVQILVWMKYKAPRLVVVDTFVEVTNSGSAPLTDCWIAVDRFKKHFDRLEPGTTTTLDADVFVDTSRSHKPKLVAVNVHVLLLQARPSECAEGIGPPAQFNIERQPRPYVATKKVERRPSVAPGNGGGLRRVCTGCDVSLK